MQLIELHILQSFPVSCLNRDDVGAPKTAVFGGCSRARISSQCLKRAARLHAQEISPRFKGTRTRFLPPLFVAALMKAGMEETEAAKASTAICELFSKKDAKKADQVTTAVFLSPKEIDQISEQVAAGVDPKKAIKQANRLDAADISLFGRMVANDASLNVEGAAMFSHALSTHKAANEVDFYSSVDDYKRGDAENEDAGAGMIGTLEYTSAVYYRYVALNLDMLLDDAHLAPLTSEERKEVVAAFLKAAVMAVPGARKNSMNANTLPVEVLAVYKSGGQPIQLVNAFEKPVKPKAGEGLVQPSIEAMAAELENLKKLWGVKHDEEIRLSEQGLQDLLEGMLRHVN